MTSFRRGNDVRTPRRHERVLARVPVSIVSRGGATGTVLFDTRDLSQGGAFLSSRLLLEVDEELELELALGDARVRAVGRVVHVSREGAPGMGIEFTRLSDADREIIRGYLQKGA